MLNQCRRQLKKRGRLPSVHNWSEHSSPAGELPVTDGDGPVGTLLQEERAAQLQTMLSCLSPAQVDALRLRFFGELKFQEIADAMGCSLSSAKNRVRWGLKKMSQMLRAQHLNEERATSSDKASSGVSR